MKILAVSLALAATLAAQRPTQTVQRISGDSTSTAVNTTSQSSASGNSNAANQNGNDLSTRTTQNSTQSPTLTQTGQQYSSSGANGNTLNAAPVTAQNGPQTTTVGQTNQGNSSAVSGPSTSSVGNVTSGPSTSSATTGDNSNVNRNNSQSNSSLTSNNAATGGAGGKATGGAGGSATAAGGSAQGGTGTGGSAQGGVASNGSQSFTGSTGASTANGTVSNNIGATNVDAADRSTTNNVNNTRVDARTLVLPPMVQPIAPGMTNSGGIVQYVSACGPQMVKLPPKELKTFRGGFLHDRMVQVGFTDEVARNAVPFIHEPLTDGRDGFIVYGSQVLVFVTKIGTSTNKGFAVGGNGGNSFSGGQLGGGTASASEQVSKDITILPCQMEVVVKEPVKPEPAAVPVAQPEPQIIYRDRIVTPEPVKPHHKRKAIDCKK